MVVEVRVHGSIYLNHKPTRLDGGQEFQLVTFQKSVGCDSSSAAGLAASSSLGVCETCLLSSAGGSFPVVGGRVMVPQSMYVWIPRTCWCYLLWDFADVHVRILRWGDYRGLSLRPSVITKVLVRERQRKTWHRRLWRWTKGPWTCNSGRGKGKQTDSLLELLEAVQPCLISAQRNLF